MKTILMLLMVMTAPGIAFGGEHPWELKKDDDGIRAYVREVEGSSILEYKGTMVVKASLEEAVGLFEDNEQTPEWFYECAESRVVKTYTPNDKIFYVAVNMPWPVKDRDAVFRQIRVDDPATGTVRYETASVPQDYPEQKGKVRMPYMKGLWLFTPLAGGGTEVLYQEHSDPGGHIPDWLVNRLAVNIPFNSLERFRVILSRKNKS